MGKFDHLNDLNDWEELTRTPIIETPLSKIVMFGLNLVKLLMDIRWVKLFLF